MSELRLLLHLPDAVAPPGKSDAVADFVSDSDALARSVVSDGLGARWRSGSSCGWHRPFVARHDGQSFVLPAIRRVG